MIENLAKSEDPQNTSINIFFEKIKFLNPSDKIQHQEIYSEIIEQILSSGYRPSDSGEVFSTLNNSSNLCRNESLEKVLKLINGDLDIKIKSFGDELNLNSCKVMGGQGFRVAMTEGFGGAVLGNKIQVVLTFDPKHVTSRREAKATDEIYKTKPNTTQVSLQIGGEIKSQDVEMISIRIPKILVGQDFMTEEEMDTEDSRFIVRHFIKE